MTERPVLFTGPNVLKVLAGKKSQTRRPVKGLEIRGPHHPGLFDFYRGERWVGAHRPGDKASSGLNLCPYGKPGDRLWVRETWAQNENQLSDSYMDTSFRYRADGETRAVDNGTPLPWRPSIHMPRWASRILLEITGVRVERLQEITEDDARAEGATPFPADSSGDCWTDGTHRTAFQYSWNELYGWHPNAFEANPWVWVVEFRRLPR